jgi:nucleotide-binding universal stress UspA family protein
MKILIGLDLSERSSKVYEVAKRYAQSMQAAVWLIHVAAPDPDFVGYRPGPQSVRDSVAEHLKEHHHKLQELAQDCRAAGLEATALLVQGPTAETLQKEAEKLSCDLIIMGSHGSGALRHLLGGSVSLAVLEKADRPVMVIPTRS